MRASVYRGPGIIGLKSQVVPRPGATEVVVRIQGALSISHRFGLAGVAEAIATVKAGRAIKALVLPQKS